MNVFMYRLYFIFVLLFIFVFQCIHGQKKPIGNGGDEDRYPEENEELLVNTSASFGDHILFGPLLIIVSLLVLRAFSKRVEE